MEEVFEINLPLLNKKALVRKGPYYLTIIRESMSNVSVDRLPLTEYFVFIDHPNKPDQIKAKLFKTVEDGKWYDNAYSEEAESNSPEFGIPEINKEIKKAIDAYEAQRAGMSPVSA
ncbi:MAG TPA: hypothetical protein VMI35_05240 [Puia sp.]|nr:hypothetical protein [Puia sp.]